MFLVFRWFTWNMNDYDIIMCLNRILRTQILLFHRSIYSIIKINFHGNIWTNSRPLFIIFNHPFNCPKANFGPLHWQGVSIALILIILLYLVCSNVHQEPHNKVGFQSTAKIISRVQTRNLWTWSWSANPLCVL